MGPVVLAHYIRSKTTVRADWVKSKHSDAVMLRSEVLSNGVATSG